MARPLPIVLIAVITMVLTSYITRPKRGPSAGARGVRPYLVPQEDDTGEYAVHVHPERHGAVERGLGPLSRGPRRARAGWDPSDRDRASTGTTRRADARLLMRRVPGRGDHVHHVGMASGESSGLVQNESEECVMRMAVADVMTTKVVSVTATTPFKDVAEALIAGGTSAVPVTDDGNRVLGTVSEADLLRKEEFRRPRSRPLA
ncbi:CBS domain-containing protein [Nonomuraea composti]|uniref:CBS domain-containing protein n=1 Tax=Nonomuraea composti TaxID=2720023 RepID=UPI001F0D6405|nr:CBS domain-containing protein [Nonomuraea sp. FMUSA5-5]